MPILHRLTVAAIQDNYEDHPIEMFPAAYKHLRMMALDPNGIALSQLERNNQRDRDDVRFLARTVLYNWNSYRNGTRRNCDGSWDALIGKT